MYFGGEFAFTFGRKFARLWHNYYSYLLREMIVMSARLQKFLSSQLVALTPWMKHKWFYSTRKRNRTLHVEYNTSFGSAGVCSGHGHHCWIWLPTTLSMKVVLEGTQLGVTRSFYQRSAQLRLWLRSKSWLKCVSGDHSNNGSPT
jgi:hypothetical protein